MRAWGPSGERPSGGILKAHCDDAVGEDIAPGDHEIGFEFFYFEFWCAHHISEFLRRDEAGESRLGDTFIARKGEQDTSLDPLETLLVNSDGDEASTRTALEAGQRCLHRTPCASGRVLGNLAAQKDDIRALHPRAIGP